MEFENIKFGKITSIDILIKICEVYILFTQSDLPHLSPGTSLVGLTNLPHSHFLPTHQVEPRFHVQCSGLDDHPVHMFIRSVPPLL